MDTKPAQRVDRALLIGIDRYQYLSPQLSGCVGDVEKLYEVMTRRLNAPADQIIKLTAGMDGQEGDEELATRANIIKALKHLAEVTRGGEQIYIHYSGHGMRNDNTILPGLEPDGRDEAIAPTDSGYGEPASYYILDKELGWLIRQITDKGALVTVVLDCCHSASGTRDIPSVKIRRGQRREQGATAGRGWEGGDPRPRANSTLVAPLKQLKAVVTATGAGTGSLLPAPKHYVLLTACRERETAKEYGSNGVFTYFMLECLNGAISTLTYRSLLDRVGSSIVGLAEKDWNYRDQTPQLEGDGDLILFGGGVVGEPSVLIATPLDDGRVKLSGGSAVGLTVGTIVALYPPGAVDFQDRAGQVALIELTQVAPDVSFGQIADGVSPDRLSAGMRSVVVRPASAKVQRRVAIGDGPALDTLRQSIARGGRDGRGSPYLFVVTPGDRQELSVVVSGGHYVILDHRDQPLPRITPPIAPGEKGAAERMVQRLEHLVQYRNAWELHNDDESSRLRDCLAIMVVRQHGRSAGRVELRPGESVRFRVHNRSGQPLSAALLYFAPDWSIKRIWPDGDTSYEELEVTDENGFEVYQAEATLPTGVPQSIERLKLFATDQPTSLDILQLGSLDTARSMTRSLTANTLEDLLADIGEGRATRQLIRRTGTGDWSTAELELETVR